MQKDDRIRVRHMIDAAQDAIHFASGKTREDLNHDRMLVLAIVKAIEIIGEAASKISPYSRELHPEVPWHRITGMRNRLIHAYFDIDLDILWQTVKVALPQLVVYLKSMISDE